MIPYTDVRRPYRMVLQYHEIFGQWYVPEIRVYFPHERGYFIIQTNSYGMRSSRPYEKQPPPGWRRILLFGDSFTDGYGVSNRERFSDLLENTLGQTEVLNFGLSGSGTDQQVLIFENLGGDFGGDVVLFCPQVENIRRVALKYWPSIDGTTGRTILAPKPYFSLEDGNLVLRHVPVPRERPFAEEAGPEVKEGAGHSNSRPKAGCVRRLVRKLLPDRLVSFLRGSGSQPFTQYNSPNSPEWRLTEALLTRVVEKAGSRRVVLAPLPLYPYIERAIYPNYLERYRAFALEHPQVLLVDVLPYFKALSASERRRCRYRNDPHYTPFAHSVVARALKEQLESAGLL